MVAYSSQKVAELKELLKQRGLSTTGTKVELIAKLEENDKAPPPEEAEAAAEPVAEDDAEEAAPPAEKAEKPVETEKEQPAKPAEAVTTNETPKPADESELLAQVIAELDRRIKRAKKFSTGNEEELEKQKLRVQKFGVNAEQADRILNGEPATAAKKHDRKRAKPDSDSTSASKPIDDPEKLEARKKRFQ